MARNEYVEPKTINSLAELVLEGDAVKIDYTEDAWGFGAPAPWDYYKLKLFLDKDGMKYGFEDDKNQKGLYITFKMVGKVMDEGDYEGSVVYCSVNTRVYRGKNISTMAGLLGKMLKDPKQLPNPITAHKLAETMEKVLKSEPIVAAEIDWKGSFSYPDPKTKGEKDAWHNVYKSWKDFPNAEEEGTKQYEVSVLYPKSLGIGEGSADVRAMLQVVRFFSAKEEKPIIDRMAEWKKKAGKGHVNGVANSLQTRVANVVVPDLVLGNEPVIHRASVTAPTADDDLALVLE